MEIIISCSDDCRGGKNVYGEPIKELVRCGECIHGELVNNRENVLCKQFIPFGIYALNWFCADGKRKEVRCDDNNT